MTDQPAARSQPVPDWLVNLAALGWRILAVLALAVVLIYVANIIMTVTAAIIVSLIFAAAFSPWVLRLRARGWSRTKAAGVVTFGILVIVVTVLVLITLAFVPYLEEMAATLQSAVAQLQSSLADLQLSPQLQSLIQDAVQWVEGQLAEQVQARLAPLAEAAAVALLSLFTVFFFLQDGDKGWVWLLQAGTGWQRERITMAGDDALVRVGGYLRGLAVLAAVNSVRDFILMMILGVPLAGPLAVLVFILSFIPYFGSLLATALIVLVTWATVGTQAALIFLVVITVLNVFEGNVMMPLVYGKTVKIHPAVALVAILAGGAIGGVLGVFAAIPLVAFATAVMGSAIAVLEPTSPTGLDFVPGWLDRLAQWSWRLLVATGLLALMVGIVNLVPSAVIAVSFSLVIAATFLPAVEWLVARGWKRGLAAIVVTIGGIGGIVAIMILAVVSMVPAIGEMVDQGSSGAGSLASSADGLLDWLVELTQTYGRSAVEAVASFLVAVGVVILLLIITTVLCYYFLSDGPRGWRATVARLPAQRRDRFDQAGRRSVRVLGGYMVATGAISAFAAATQWLIMTLLGLPLALPLAVLAFFLGFIPYFGSLVSTLLAFFVTVQVGTTEQIAIMAIWTLVFNIVQGNIVAPLVYGRAVNLHPAVVLLAIPAANSLAGVLGMFLVVPFLGIVAANWRSLLRAIGDVPPGVEPAADEATPAEEPASSPTPLPGGAPAPG